MKKTITRGGIDKSILRVVDANFNRAKEGMRVCEDTLRFVFNSEQFSKEFKALRHNLTGALKLLNIKLSIFINERDSLKDVGRNNNLFELKREAVAEVFFANIQRLKESIRVLEEFSKLVNENAAKAFKRIRYRVYQLEKETVKKFPALSNFR